MLLRLAHRVFATIAVVSLLALALQTKYSLKVRAAGRTWFMRWPMACTHRPATPPTGPWIELGRVEWTFDRVLNRLRNQQYGEPERGVAIDEFLWCYRLQRDGKVLHCLNLFLVLGVAGGTAFLLGGLRLVRRYRAVPPADRERTRRRTASLRDVRRPAHALIAAGLLAIPVVLYGSRLLLHRAARRANLAEVEMLADTGRKAVALERARRALRTRDAFTSDFYLHAILLAYRLSDFQLAHALLQELQVWDEEAYEKMGDIKIMR
jgi:hypothetical protein